MTWATQNDIHKLTVMMTVCTKTIVQAIAIAVERAPDEGFDMEGGRQVRELLKIAAFSGDELEKILLR